MSEVYTVGQIIDKLQFGQVAIKVEGIVGEPYGQVGEAIYYDEDDYGKLKSFITGNEIFICRTTRVNEDDGWIIVDAEEMLDTYKS